MRRRSEVVRLPRSGRRKLWLAGLIGLVLVASAAVPAQAQQRRRGVDPEARMEMLKERLQLTDEQVAQLQPIFAKHDERRHELFQQQSAERQAMREQMQALRLEMDKELAEVLSQEQMESLRALREETRRGLRQGRGGNRGGKRGGPPPSDG